jgi:hypothetical protein
MTIGADKSITADKKTAAQAYLRAITFVDVNCNHSFMILFEKLVRIPKTDRRGDRQDQHGHERIDVFNYAGNHFLPFEK